MRRISLALALLGAVAAAGCGGAGNSSQATNNRGVPGSAYTVTVRQPTGGTIVSGKIDNTGAFVLDNRINCSATSAACEANYAWDPALADSVVALRATAATGNIVEGWAGDCNGTNVTPVANSNPAAEICRLSGKADKYVLVRFNAPDAVTSHPNWSADSSLHMAQVNSFALQCNRCHGLDWTGVGIAPSCYGCHNLDAKVLNPVDPALATTGGHFNKTQEAWTAHTTSKDCARCHTNGGFRDWIGLDGSANYLYNGTNADGTYVNTTITNYVDAFYAPGPMQCKTCHNSVSDPIKAGIVKIIFPSGKSVTTDPATGLCGQCHQARNSSKGLDTVIGTTGANSQFSPAIGFKNPHYFGAAATIFGNDAAGWAQFSGTTYTGTFAHGGLNSCTFCHDPHDPVAIKVADCTRCHAGVTDLAGLENMRQIGYTEDIDGDGNTTEGIKAEIDGLGATLLSDMVQYATSGTQTICYDDVGTSGKYFFYTTSTSGACNAGDVVSTNEFKQFTPNLLKAAYNYKFYKADPGAWAHNPRYAAETLSASILKLRTKTGITWTARAPGARTFANAQVTALSGHFDPTGAMAGHNSTGCGRCHNNAAFRDYTGADGTAANYLTMSYPSGTGQVDGTTFAAPGQFQCNGCHNPVTEPINAAGTWAKSKKFPSGNVITLLDASTAICAQCHDGGRPGYEVSQIWAQSPEAAFTALSADTQISGSNNKAVRAHYLPAASTLFGAEAANWYQYPSQVYSKRNEHGGQASCTFCHDPHSGQLPADADIRAKCGGCHYNEAGAAVSSFLELEEVRQFGFEGDIDGDGVNESLNLEINGLGAKLFEAIQAYAVNVGGAAICIADNKPWIQASTVDACGTGANATSYNKFTPSLLRAVYNYLLFQNDTGAWAHNPRYVVEVLFDSISDMNRGLGTNAVSFAGLRGFDGHFGGASKHYATMMYHYYPTFTTGWPVAGFSSAACYQCHGGNGGFTLAVTNAATQSMAQLETATPGSAKGNKVTALNCDTCHALDGNDMRGLRADVPNMYFPPQKDIPVAAAQNQIVIASSTLPNSFAVCGTCHSGLENGSSVDIKIATMVAGHETDPDWVSTFAGSATLPHYLGAAGMLLGNDAKVGYQYGTNVYTGKPIFFVAARNGNAPGPYGSAHGADCAGCHQPKASKHSFEVDYLYCGTCHTGTHLLANIEHEFTVARGELYAAIQNYVAAHTAAPPLGTGRTGICFDGASYPYWFVAAGGAGSACTATGFGNGRMDQALMKATYNYVWAVKEPGAWAHNEKYVFQLMYDSIVDLGYTPSFARPTP